VSAYRLGGTRLTVLDAAVPTTETAACWVRVLGDYLYVTNTASGTISGFQIAPGGTLTLLDDDGITATTGANPRDLSIALRFVYAQSDGRLDAYRIREDGSLAEVGSVAVPATARGVASR
jgi:6-phosphogluconolactonase (cycloisomerase 2 family)